MFSIYFLVFFREVFSHSTSVPGNSGRSYRKFSKGLDFSIRLRQGHGEPGRGFRAVVQAAVTEDRSKDSNRVVRKQHCVTKTTRRPKLPDTASPIFNV